MIATTLSRLAHATGANLSADRGGVVVRAVATDSREVQGGDLFVAVVGDRHDGHDHAAEAVARGAVAVLASRPVEAPAVLLVPDTVVALGQIAHDLLERLRADGGPRVLAVTGSVGKTGTKDLLAQVLEAAGPTVAAPGSYNNDIGLPTTVLRCEATTRYLVLEMGARGLGHIARLTRVARPEVGIVLGVGSAHLGEFGSREAIALAKSELVAALPADGVAVLNADDPLVRAMARRTAARVVTYGTAVDAAVRAVDVRLDASGRPSFQLVLDQRTYDLSLQLVGEPAVGHALAAVAAAHALGLPVGDAVDVVRGARGRSPGRLEVTTTPDGVVVVDDSYNASPESMAAALRTVAAMAVPPGGRTWAVLGEMRELGASSVTEHRTVGRLVAELGLDRLVVVGPAGRAILQAASEEGGVEVVPVPDVPAAVALVRAQVRPGDLVLVKASRAVGLEAVAHAVRDGRGDGPAS